MATYAETGLEVMENAARLSEDYFLLNRDQFMKRWMPGKGQEIRRQTTGTSWNAIVEGLGNRVQQEIVTDDRDRTNVLVLAGPGSGKTRVLVHRIAYLLRMKREDPRGILVLAYNRHAAAEIRVRLRALVGDDAFGVTISTCHALAMKLVGASFSGIHADAADFDTVIAEAVRLLTPEGLTKSEAEAHRESLIQGYRWILVDEYQDVGPEVYALISAVAGRSLEDADLKLSLFAVGDDDQNIYAFDGASVEYIRRFEEDYRARPSFLIENYRSTAHIIAAANAVISGAPDRMKLDHEITINADRASHPPGGRLQAADTVAQGRVQLLDVPAGDRTQAVVAVDELMRLSRLDPEWNWARTAVISRDWKRLGAVRAYAERQGLKVEMANEDLPNIWRLRETQRLVADLRAQQGDLLGIQGILAILNRQPRNRWIDLLAEGVAELARELKSGTMPVPDLVEWFAEWSRDTLGEQRGLLLLTAHRAKGLEFDHVAILNGGWDSPGRNEDREAPRRLFYVAMIRARQSLTVLTSGAHPLLKPGSVLHRPVRPILSPDTTSRAQYQMPAMDVVDLSFAGRLPRDHEAHAAIRDARVGDAISLEFREPYWVLLDAARRQLGRMARSWTPPSGFVVASGQVGAIVNWRKVDNKEEFIKYLKRDAWETILPEIRFQPQGSPLRAQEHTDQAAAEITAERPPTTTADENEGPAPKSTTVDAPAPQSASLPLLDALKEILHDAVSRASTWDDLSESLEELDLELVPRGGGLVVRELGSTKELCKLSVLGLRYIELIRRFGDGFPGHPQTWLVERALTDKYVPKGPKRSKRAQKKGPNTGDEDLDVIEDCVRRHIKWNINAV